MATDSQVDAQQAPERTPVPDRALASGLPKKPALKVVVIQDWAELAGYAARVEDLTLLAERRRMARELHDTLAQGLAGLILQFEAVRMHLAEGRTERASEIIKVGGEGVSPAARDSNPPGAAIRLARRRPGTARPRALGFRRAGRAGFQVLAPWEATPRAFPLSGPQPHYWIAYDRNSWSLAASPTSETQLRSMSQR